MDHGSHSLPHVLHWDVLFDNFTFSHRQREFHLWLATFNTFWVHCVTMSFRNSRGGLRQIYFNIHLLPLTKYLTHSHSRSDSLPLALAPLFGLLIRSHGFRCLTHKART